ncbi:hypothetical protein CUMW_243340, partial [Citrus unshiu]
MHEDPSSNVSERSIEKTDEEQKNGDKHSQCNLSRYRVSAFTKVISTLSPDQQTAIREIGFGSMPKLRCGRLRQDFCETLVQQSDTKRHCIVFHSREFCLNPTTFSIVMGIKDGGEPIYIREEAGTVLCPSSASYINLMYMHVLKDVQLIRKKNWATWCFNFLWEGIAKYKDHQVKSVSGCVVFLELFYFSAVLYDRCSMDRTVCPISVWTKEEIWRLLNWRKKFGDMTSTEVPMCESNFLQLERNFPYFEQIEDAGPSTVNIEEAFRVLTQCVQRIEHKMNSFNVRMEMVEKSLDELRSKSLVGAPSKQPSDPCPPSLSLKIVEPTCLVRKTEPTTDGKNKMVMDSDEDSVDCRLNLNLDKIMGWMGTREGIGEFHKDPTHFVPISPPNLRDEDIDEPVQLKQEPQTSTSVSVLPTRPSRNRRPGRYQLSPYDQVSRGANPKYKAGDFYKSASPCPHSAGGGERCANELQAVLMVGDEVDCFARAARCGKNFMQHVHRSQKPQLPSNMQHMKFQDFPINWGIGVPKQRNGYDYGVYVINYMDSPEFIPKKSSIL